MKKGEAPPCQRGNPDALDATKSVSSGVMAIRTSIGLFDGKDLRLAQNGRRLRKDSFLRRQTENLVCNLIFLRGGQTYDELDYYVVNTFPHLKCYLLTALANLCHSGNGHRRKLVDEIDNEGRRTYFIDECSPEWLE